MSLTDSAIEILEDECVLSNSIIWPMIEEYYGSAGPKAWHETPYYPTSNAFIGETYAQLIVAFLRDVRAAIDPAQPVYIIELAAGMGAFSFFVLRALQRIRRVSPSLKGLNLRYIVTDFTERNISALENDPVFQGFAAEGILDFAIYTPEKDAGFRLRGSGVDLRSSATANPVIALSNYFFDSIRHDYFQVEEGQLKEAKVRAYRRLQHGRLEKSKPVLAEISLMDRYRAVSTDYYPDARLNEILRSYTESCSPGSFLFPVGAFRSISNLLTLSGNRLLLLATDKGFGTRDSINGLSQVPYTPHTGSFSYMVNFEAIGSFFRRQNGAAWHAHENFSVTTMAASTFPAEELELTAAAAQIWLQTINPVQSSYQLWSLLTHFGPGAGCDPRECFQIATACVRLSFHDPLVLAKAGEYLCGGYNPQDLGMRLNLEDILGRVEDNLHRTVVGAREGLAYLRRLYFLVGDDASCLRMNRLWTEWFEEERDVHFYPAAILEKQGDRAGALGEYRKAAQFDPESAICREAIERMTSQAVVPGA
jgi:hypothetical protein